MRSIQTDRLLTIKEVAKRLNTDEGTVRYWIRSRLITYVSLPMHTERPAYRIWQSTLVSIVAKDSNHE